MGEAAEQFTDVGSGRPWEGGRIEGWTTLRAAELWAAWRPPFASDDGAIVTALWAANRLVKPLSPPTKRLFYSIKDGAMDRYSEEGQVARVEKLLCYACDGVGCERCTDGVYQERTLYVHRFAVDGQRYSFHSYRAPLRIVAGIAPDGMADRFGSPFTDAEVARLRLPVTGLIAMLKFVAAAQWSMVFSEGVYGGRVQRYNAADGPGAAGEFAGGMSDSGGGI